MVDATSDADGLVGRAVAARAGLSGAPCGACAAVKLRCACAGGDVVAKPAPPDLVADLAAVKPAFAEPKAAAASRVSCLRSQSGEGPVRPDRA